MEVLMMEKERERQSHKANLEAEFNELQIKH